MSGLARATAILFLSRPTSSFTAVHSHRHFRHFATAQLFTTTTSLSTSSTSMTSASKSTILPPLPRRDEERVVYAGIGPNTRQSNDSTEPLMDPPVSIHDPYGWMRDDDRTDEEVLTYLKAENEYSKAMTEHLCGLQTELYDEFLSSIQETDFTTPRPRGEYWYYTRTFKGMSYTAYCRAPKVSGESFVIDWDGTKEMSILPGEEIYLDVNELAKDKSYCSVGSVKMSPSATKIAYTVDYSGDEKYEMHVRDLVTGGEDVALKSGDELLEVDGLEWGENDDMIYYTTMDDQHRPFRLYQRNLGADDATTDTLLKEDLDDLYWCGVSKSLDGKYIFFESASKETSEIWYLPVAEEKSAEMKCIAGRRNKVLYEVEHGQDKWFIWTNVDGAPNMKLMSAPAISDSADAWKVVENSNGVPIFDGSLSKSLDSVTVVNTHLIAEGREGGIPRVWIVDIDTKTTTRLEFDESAYNVCLLSHYEADTKTITVSYDSMLTPPSSIDIVLGDDSERTVLKTKTVPGYDKSKYGFNRMEVLSRDGKTKIPISVVYQRETMEKVKAGERVPCHLYGYGSYGMCMEAGFSSTRLPLLDRGMIYNVAHIRGGGEMGRNWYEEPNGGKYLCKMNTFNDFVDVAKFLVDGWTTPNMLSCEGRSAGGLLIGASINQAPELFRCAILGVPFVDVVCTMTDSTIPLTTGEWIEWGNPNEARYYQYMMDYSPMNNVQSGKKYPACWLTGGLHDPRVAYWEPAKFTATLRHANPGNEYPVCMKLDLSAGHFSASDRYKYYKELAYDYSFLLDQLKLNNA